VIIFKTLIVDIREGHFETAELHNNISFYLQWTESFKLLTNLNEQNKAHVEVIEKSLFLLCLDGSSKGFDRPVDDTTRSG
jgi:hypothetical protein